MLLTIVKSVGMEIQIISAVNAQQHQPTFLVECQVAQKNMLLTIVKSVGMEIQIISAVNAQHHQPTFLVECQIAH